MSRIKNLNNNIYGRLKVLEFDSLNENKRALWKCRCDCGNEIIVSSKHLISGNTKSCGCLQKEVASKNKLKHDMSKTRFYRIWMQMKARCNNKNNGSYYKYGALGIRVCNRWLSFENFYLDMYESYLKHIIIHGEADTTIERKDGKNNYNKDNCIWATYVEQNNNRKSLSNFKATSPDGKEYIDNNRTKFALEHGLEKTSVGRYLRSYSTKKYKGWHFEYI